MRLTCLIAGLVIGTLPVHAQSESPFAPPPVPVRAAKPKLTTAPAPPAATQVKGIPLINMPMKVALVRGGKAGCTIDCREWIMAEGQIDKSTPPLFRKVLKALGTRKVPILINSGGGMVDEALEIGRLIRVKGLDVAVSRSQVMSSCPATDTACRNDKSHDVIVPRAQMAYCASSCAFILAAGTRRYAGPQNLVGVHQIASFKTTAQILQKFRVLTRPGWGGPVEVKRELISEKRVNEKTFQTQTPESAYRMIAKYFAEMGVGDGVVSLIKATPNASMHWLTASERNSTRLVTETMDGEELITGVVKTYRPTVNPTVRVQAPAVTTSMDAFRQGALAGPDSCPQSPGKPVACAVPSTAPAAH